MNGNLYSYAICHGILEDFVQLHINVISIIWQNLHKLRYQGIHVSWRKFRYVSTFIFTPPGTLNEPTSSLPITPAQNMTPPPHCCRLTLDGFLQPFTSQPLHQPSGPSSVALHSSVKKTTVWKSVVTLFGPFKSLISVPGG